MKLSDLTIENISDFVEGYSKWFLDNLRALPRHKKEQILFRASKCPKECIIENKCKFCKCDYPQKLYVNKSCNSDSNLPDLMSEKDWNSYKESLKNEKSKLN